MHSSGDSPFEGVPSVLISDRDPGEAELLSDMPFLALGSIGIAMLLFMVSTGKLTRSSGVLILSIMSAFIGAVMDVGNVIVEANSATESAMFPLVVAREVFFAVSLGAKFFYVWHLSGQSVAALMLGGNAYPASWARWGLGGNLANITLLILSAGIGLTQLIWRAGLLFLLKNYMVLYDLDAVLEIVTVGLLFFKLVLNIWFSPPFSPSRAAKVYAPLIFATLLGLSGPVGNLLAFMFSETPYGRLLEAVQLYLYALYAFVLTFYGSLARPSGRNTEKAAVRPRRTSLLTIASFRDASRPVSLSPPYSYPSPAPLLQSNAPEQAGYNRPNANRRSTAERLSQWVSERVVSHPEAGASRSWLDLERGHRRERSRADRIEKRPVQPISTSLDGIVSASKRSNSGRKGTGKGSTSSRGAGASETVVSPTNGGRRATSRSSKDLQSPDDANDISPSIPTISYPYGRPDVRTDMYASYKRPSISGRPNIARIGASNLRSDTPSTDLDVALQEQDERDKTIADLLQSQPSTRSQSLLTPHSNSHRSGTSDISLSNFPSPPGLGMPAGKSMFPRRLLLPSVNFPERNRLESSPDRDDDIVVDDVVFKLAPPNWKRGADRKGDSYGSLTSSAAIGQEQYKGSAQWDITSFIGGVMSPAADSINTPTRTSAGPSVRRDMYTTRYPSAIASSTVLSPIRSDAGSEDTAQILEVTYARPITRMMPAVPGGVNGVKTKRPFESIERQIAKDDAAVAREKEARSTPSPSGSGTASPVLRLSPPKIITPGKTSPFPIRPLAGLGSLSTQLRTTSPGGSDRLDSPDMSFEKPRPAPSPASMSQNSPQEQRALPASGAFF